MAHNKACSCRFHTTECMKFTISACQYLVMSLISSPNNSLPSAQSSIAYLQNNVSWSLEFRDWAFFHGNLEGFMEDDCPHCALSSSHFWFWGSLVSRRMLRRRGRKHGIYSEVCVLVGLVEQFFSRPWHYGHALCQRQPWLRHGAHYQIHVHRVGLDWCGCWYH